MNERADPAEAEDKLRDWGAFGGYCNMCRYPILVGQQLCPECRDKPQLTMDLRVNTGGGVPSRVE